MIGITICFVLIVSILIGKMCQNDLCRINSSNNTNNNTDIKNYTSNYINNDTSNNPSLAPTSQREPISDNIMLI